MKNQTYVDNASTTKIDAAVKKEMDKYFTQIFGNPNSNHLQGRLAKNAVEQSRAKVAKILNCKPSEIIFTSGGTESINLAIQGIARAIKNKGKHIITTKIEHPAVLETCKYLKQNEGFEITYLDVDNCGFVDIQQLQKSIQQDTILITAMYANNEIGTIQQIQKIAEIAREKKVYFHTDACQAAGMLELNVKELNIDLMTLNASKINGPKGSGILYVKSGVQIMPLIFGGGQENGLRSGTENVPAITGFAKALEIAQKQKKTQTKKITAIRDNMIKNLLQKIPSAKLNGPKTQRLANNINISIKGIDGDAIVSALDEQGILASTGSACTNSKIEQSHVLLAIGLDEETAMGTIRLTLGKQTTQK